MIVDRIMLSIVESWVEYADSGIHSILQEYSIAINNPSRYFYLLVS